MNDIKINDNWQQLKTDWERKGFKCELFKSLPGEGWSSKGHETDEMFILLEGEVEVSFQGKTYSPTIGEGVIVPANVPHTFKNPGKKENILYALYAYEWQDGVSATPLGTS